MRLDKGTHVLARTRGKFQGEVGVANLNGNAGGIGFFAARNTT